MDTIFFVLTWDHCSSRFTILLALTNIFIAILIHDLPNIYTTWLRMLLTAFFYSACLQYCDFSKRSVDVAFSRN